MLAQLAALAPTAQLVLFNLPHLGMHHLQQHPSDRPGLPGPTSNALIYEHSTTERDSAIAAALSVLAAGRQRTSMRSIPSLGYRRAAGA